MVFYPFDPILGKTVAATTITTSYENIIINLKLELLD